MQCYRLCLLFSCLTSHLVVYSQSIDAAAVVAAALLEGVTIGNVVSYASSIWKVTKISYDVYSRLTKPTMKDVLQEFNKADIQLQHINNKIGSLNEKAHLLKQLYLCVGLDGLTPVRVMEKMRKIEFRYSTMKHLMADPPADNGTLVNMAYSMVSADRASVVSTRDQLHHLVMPSVVGHHPGIFGEIKAKYEETHGHCHYQGTSSKQDEEFNLMDATPLSVLLDLVVWSYTKAFLMIEQAWRLLTALNEGNFYMEVKLEEMRTDEIVEEVINYAIPIVKSMSKETISNN